MPNLSKTPTQKWGVIRKTEFKNDLKCISISFPRFKSFFEYVISREVYAMYL